MTDRTAPAASPGTAVEASLTTGALARRLGVSPTTLRSWDRRYGIGPAVRDDGRHRRWTPVDVAVLEAMCRLTSSGVPPAEAARLARGREGEPEPLDALPAPRTAHEVPSAPPGRSRAPGALPLGDVRQECRGLARAAVRLDAPAVEQQLADAVLRYGVVTAWEEVMMPTLHAVGRKWESSGDRYVEVEHLLSWHVSTTLRRHTPAPAGPGDGSPGPVVLACVPDEQHTLAIEALNAGLGERRTPTRMFGAAVPVEALVASVRRLGPTAVVLWAQVRSTASVNLARRVADTQWGVKGARRRPLVVLAGPGWAGAPREMPRPPSLSSAVETLSGAYALLTRAETTERD
ncbi:MerR family transcriptional regulator [Streptomyces doudnae]|uniref:MerR family transcriptional regulator n=3 Tax=Streptomyces TaxID=1883 RepID=A0ABD5ET86_9ACTN|nr:MerR family transcriptional regulator [Streptomyces sp. DSM 41981]MDT0436612.1 MerR family transcriptional regulator [Streptomyces sp. DSM 41981]